MAAPSGIPVPTKIVHDDRPENVTDKPPPCPAGGEQAANVLQPDSSSRHATTLNAKVRGMIEALRLVMSWRCLRSPGRGHRFETVTPTT
jgi:hypothetical protein